MGQSSLLGEFILLTLIIFIIVLGILVLVHEFGHFIVAKRSGMRVDEFAFGFPPRLFGIKRGETLYSFNAIPFGGFVRIHGEGGEDKKNFRSFASRGAWSKTKVILAGVLMNILLAFVLLTIGNAVGLRIGIVSENDRALAQDLKVQIISVVNGAPAGLAGLRVLDEITKLSMGDTTIHPGSVEEVQSFVTEHRGKEIDISINRGEKIQTFSLVPRENPPKGEGAMGIALVTTGVVRYPWYESIWRAALMTFSLTVAVAMGIFEFFKTLLFEAKIPPGVSGPVGIFVLTGQFASLGFSALMTFVAQISIALAVFNILPFVPLDGGRQLLIIIEKIRGKALSKNVEAGIALAGWAFLIGIFIFITRNDILKFF